MTTSPTSFPLDRRTRRNADVRPVTAAEFLGDEFPRLAARHGHLVARGIYTLKPPPLAIEVGADSWTLTSDGAPLVSDVSMGAVTHGDVLAGRAQPEELVPFGGGQAHKAFALAVGLQLLVDALTPDDGFGAVLLVAHPEADPVPPFRAAAAGARLPGDRR